MAETPADPNPPKLDDKQRQIIDEYPKARQAIYELQRKSEWWRRYWKRFVLAGIIGTIATAALVIWVLFVVVLGGIKNSAPFQDAVRRAATDPQVVAALGQPIKAGWLISGSTLADKGVAATELRIPISGPNGKATLHVAGSKPPGLPWRYQQLTAELPAGITIDLLRPAGK